MTPTLVKYGKVLILSGEEGYSKNMILRTLYQHLSRYIVIDQPWYVKQ